MKLYNISERDVSSIIELGNTEQEGFDGKHEIISSEMAGKHSYPIKVVFSFEGEQIVVITAYPLKKEMKK